MPNIDVNGQTIDYPDIGDPNWGDNATNFAIQTSAALGKIGLSSGISVNITQTLDVTGNTTLDANLSVGGNASITGNTTLTGDLTVNGNTQLGNANTDTIGVTGIVNIDSGVLYVDPVNNRVGINDTTPSQALDVNGNALISGTLGVTGDVAINTNKFNVTASSGNTTIAGTLGVTGNATVDGVIYADDSTTANTPVISFIGDTNTGIGRSAADTLDFITNGNSRFRIESTGQLQAVISGNTTFYPGFLCRAWVNFDGTLSGTISARGSGNISSVVKNSTGNYTINIDIDMPDANYCVVATTIGSRGVGVNTRNAGSLSITTVNYTPAVVDLDFIGIAIFR